MTDGSVTLVHWGEETRFRLALGELRQLQEAINRPRIAIGLPPVGPTSLARLIVTGDAWPQEVREVLRLGLLGAGVKPYDAQVLIKQHVDAPGMFVQSCAMAAAVLAEALKDDPADPAGKAQPVPPKTETTTGCDFPSSTGKVLQ